MLDKIMFHPLQNQVSILQQPHWSRGIASNADKHYLKPHNLYPLNKCLCFINIIRTTRMKWTQLHPQWIVQKGRILPALTIRV